jgi:hypothetical protein
MIEHSAFVSVVQNEELQINCQVVVHTAVLQEVEAEVRRTVGM